MKGRHNNNRGNFNSHNILPSARILHEYETASSGSINKLMEMAKKEQEHRHSWQNCYLKSHSFTYGTGQLFGFIYNVFLLYIIFRLIKSGDIHSAIKLFIINALLIALAIVITFTERKITTRKPPRRGVNQDSAEDNKPDHRSRKSHNNSGNHSSGRENRGRRDRDEKRNRPNRGDKGGY